MTKMTLQEPITTAQKIATKIFSYYNEMKEREALHKLIREVTEEKVLDHYIETKMQEKYEPLEDQLMAGLISEEEFNQAKIDLRPLAKRWMDESFIFEGHILKYKVRKAWSWSAELDEELEDIGCLHVVKEVLVSQENRHDLLAYKLPESKYVRIYNHLNDSTEEKKTRKANDAEKLNENKKQLQLKNMEEILMLFKENKEALKKLEEQYEKDRAKLMAEMEEKDLELVLADEEGTVGFKLLGRTGGYSTADIAMGTVDKKFLFTYKEGEDGKIEAKDWYTGKSFELLGDTLHDGHTLLLDKDVLHVDGIPLYSPDLADFKELSKKHIKSIVAANLHVAYGTLEIDGSTFLKTCKTSTSKIEQLVEEGKLPLSTLEKHRHIASEDDISVFFEMVESEADVQRRTFFHKRISFRNERIRKDGEERKKLKDLYNLS